MATRKPVSEITDRAKRYRANADHKKRKRCECTNREHGHGAVCGSKRFLVVGHRDGDESNGRDSNLFTQCKSCNTKDGKRDARLGRGVRTRQYNPKHKRNAGAGNLAQYVQAAVDHTRGAHDAGGLVIHQTPKAKRKEFAREIAWRKGYRNPRGRAEGELEVEDKTTHTEVGYEPHSKHTPEACANCVHFIGATPPRCQTVKSPISPKAWCERYDPASSKPNPILPRMYLGYGPGRPTKKELRHSRRTFKAGVRRKVKEEREYIRGLKKSARRSAGQSRTERIFHEVYGPEGIMNPSDKIYKEWRSGKLRTSAGELVPRTERGEKIARAILLSELRREGKIPARMNPEGATADELYTMFHGRGPDESYSVPVPGIDPYGEHPEIAQLGILTRLMVGEGVLKLGGDYGDEVIEAEDGYFCNVLEFCPHDKYIDWLESEPETHEVRNWLRKHGAPDLAADPNGARQLYIVGGNQDIDDRLAKLGCDPSKDICELGECYLVDYFTQKRFDHFERTNYYHALGEKTGVRPRLLYYRRQKLLGFAGGEYFVTRRGIEN